MEFSSFFLDSISCRRLTINNVKEKTKKNTNKSFRQQCDIQRRCWVLLLSVILSYNEQAHTSSLSKVILGRYEAPNDLLMISNSTRLLKKDFSVDFSCKGVLMNEWSSPFEIGPPTMRAMFTVATIS